MDDHNRKWKSNCFISAIPVTCISSWKATDLTEFSAFIHDMSSSSGSFSYGIYFRNIPPRSPPTAKHIAKVKKNSRKIWCSGSRYHIKMTLMLVLHPTNLPTKRWLSLYVLGWSLIWSLLLLTCRKTLTQYLERKENVNNMNILFDQLHEKKSNLRDVWA